MKICLSIQALLSLPVLATLTITEHASLPTGAIQNWEGNNGATTVNSGISKGQSVTLNAASQLTGFAAKIVSVTTASDITVSVYATSAGKPTGQAIHSDSGTLPSGLVKDDYVQFSFQTALNLEAGNYAIVLETNHSDLDFRLNTQNSSYPGGSLVKNTGSGWSNVTSDFVFSLLGTISTPDPDPVRPLPSTGPNIVFILVDDFGWTDHSVAALANGNQSTFYQTPNMKRLASEGVSFTSAYAQPNCAPTRAALLTGQYSPRTGNGVYNVDKLDRQGGKTTYTTPADQGDEHVNGDENTITIAEAFYNSGYVTAHFGKYHAGASNASDPTHPLNQGFDYNYGGNNWGNPGNFFANLSAPYKFGSNIGPELDPFADPYTSSYINDHLSPYANGNDPSSLVDTKKHLTDAMADAFVSFMDEHRSGPMAAYPVYTQLHFYAVHTPIQGRSDLKAKYQNIKDDPGYIAGNHTGTGYAALVENMDHSLGRVLDYLDDPNNDGDTSDSIAENTVVIFTSDNGGSSSYTSNKPLRGTKGMHYEGGIRVPLIIRQPGVGNIPSNKVSNTLVHCVDYYPTMLDFASGVYPDATTHPLDGESLHAHLLDPDNATRNRAPVFYHFPGYMDNRAYACSVVIKDIGNQRYKYIYAYDPYYNPGSGTTDGFDQYQLYNLTDDISESVNLMDFIDEENANDPDDPSASREYWDYIQNKHIANELASDLNSWLQGTPGDSTWNPIYVTYQSNYPGIDPARVGQSSGPAPAVVAEVDVPLSQSFRIIASSTDELNNVTLTFPSEPGFTYQIQGSSSLESDSWNDLGSPITPTSGTSTQHTAPDPAAETNNRRFYRVILLP